MTVESTIDFAETRIMVEDITDRVDELRDERDDYNDPDAESPNMADWADVHPDDAAELVMLENILDELKGGGGDHQWNGDWYPHELLAESDFVEYIKELIDDCYEMPKEMNSGSWPYRHMSIDYEAAAKEAEQDYSTITIDGNDFFYR